MSINSLFNTYLFLDTAATSTRKFTEKSEIFRDKTSHMVLSIKLFEDKHNIVLHLSVVML